MPTSVSNQMMCSLIPRQPPRSDASRKQRCRGWCRKSTATRRLECKRGHTLCQLLSCRVRTSVNRGTDDFPAQLHDRRRQKRLGRQIFGVTGIGGASRPLPEQEQKRPRLSATRLKRPRPRWPLSRRRSRSPRRRRTQNRRTRGKLPASRFPTARRSACLGCWFRGEP